MKRHLYYQLTMTLLSPLSLGSGDDRDTDADVLLDARGKPYIPGTSLAGVLRRCFDSEMANRVFGNIENGTSVCSQVYVYDSLLHSHSFHISQRDQVALDRYKTAIEKKKFDREVVDRGAVFNGILEIPHTSTDETITAIGDMLCAIQHSGLYIGAKTNRGLGRVGVNVVYKDFNLDDEKEKEAWLCFDPFAPDAFADARPIEGKLAHMPCLQLELTLKNRGAISIREYTTDVDDVDYASMRDTVSIGKGDAPGAVIPGTSWAGAFRHRVNDFLEKDELLRDLFGDVVKEGSVTTAYRSKIRFSETVLTGGEWVTLSHNAIDRFSGKVKDGALFSEKTYYDGSGTLHITVEKELEEAEDKALAAAILDLHKGYLAVGGLTAIGRGIFSIERMCVNGQDIPEFEDALKGGLLNVVK